MISIDFLSLGRSGIEFIDFQTTRFYDTLSACAEDYISTASGKAVLDPAVEKEMLRIIEEFTGFDNIKVKFKETDNFAVDTGYFSPNHVLRNEGTQELLGPTKTTLYRWFVENKVKLFKGAIDYKTGKVEGSFKSVPVTLYINVNLNDVFPQDKVTKYGVPISGIFAGAIAHELGHVFGGCMMLHTAASDNLVAKAALHFYKSADRAEDRVVVLKDAAALLELDSAKQNDLMAIAQTGDENSFILYWNKLVSQRNNRRSLSVGVETMSSEVVADMYAIRMGCGKGVVAAISSFVDAGAITVILNSLLMAAMMTILGSLLYSPVLVIAFSGAATATPFFFFTGIVFSIMFVIDYFSRGYSGAYNAGHRRFEDAVRQMIAQLKEDKTLNLAARADLIKETDRLLELSKTFKPWFDNTVIGRTMGWVFNGSDFKKQEIEHYTQVLANHELSVFGAKLAALKDRRDPNIPQPREEGKTFEY